MAKVAAQDPNYRERVRGMFRRQPFMTGIGAKLRRLSPGRADIEVRHRPDLTQQHGFFHGGIVGAIADNAGGAAAYTLFPADSSVLTVEFKLNLMAPAQGVRLLATSRTVRSGRTLTVSHSEVYVFDEAGQKRHCATALVTLMALHGVPDTPEFARRTANGDA